MDIGRGVPPAHTTVMQAPSRSAAMYERAMRVLPGGVSRNAVLRDPHPLYVDHASGCRIVDIEGVERIDFGNNMASLIHGHADPDTLAAVTGQLARGTAFNMGTRVEIEYAEYLSTRNPGFERMRFVNSGTEALMLAIKASRAFTERPMIAKGEGAYHGAYDTVEVSQTPTPAQWGDAREPAKVPLVHGTPQSVLDEVVVFPYNNTDATLALFERAKDHLACVVLDLMPHRVGLNPVDPAYVRAIAGWCKDRGVLLVLDEVITFRSGFGGLQERYGLVPDLTAMGKMIGGGFPIGAVAGRAEVMDVLNPRSKRYGFPHSGTFSANPVSLTAGMATMKKFDSGAVDRLNTLADRAVAGIERAIAQTGARASVTGAGSMFRVHMKSHAPRDYRDAHTDPDETRRLKALLDHMFDEGFVLINSGSCALSTPMREDDIDALVAALGRGFERIASMP